MGLALAPQTGEPKAMPPNPMARALHGPMGSRGAISCWHRCSTHGERGQSRWRVGRQWSILVVLCCVLWVVGSRAEYCNVSSTSEVVLCPILYCIDVLSTYLGKILDFVVVHWSFIFVSHVSRLIVEFI